MTDYSNEDATILMQGNRFYIGFGCMRRTSEYKTPERAASAARKLGFRSVTIDAGAKLGLVSISHFATVCTEMKDRDASVVSFGIDGCSLRGTVYNLNQLLPKMGFKQIRITYNMLNREAGPLVIDRDTPSYMDVGSEAYHSM